MHGVIRIEKIPEMGISRGFYDILMFRCPVFRYCPSFWIFYPRCAITDLSVLVVRARPLPSNFPCRITNGINRHVVLHHFRKIA